MADRTLGPEQLEAVARLFRVLSEPTRLSLLQELQTGEKTVGELVRRLDLKQANVSKQLGELHDAGLVARERDGNEVNYRIADPMAFDLCALVCGKLRRDAQRQLDALVASAVPRRKSAPRMSS